MLMINEELYINNNIKIVHYGFYKFYSFYMKGWDEPCLGIIQSIGDEWILIKKIIVNHNYILN